MNGPGLFVHPSAATEVTTDTAMGTVAFTFAAPLADPATRATTAAAPPISYTDLYMRTLPCWLLWFSSLTGPELADSDGSRTGVPIEAEHPFRRKPNTRSERSRTVIPSQAEHPVA